MNLKVKIEYEEETKIINLSPETVIKTKIFRRIIKYREKNKIFRTKLTQELINSKFVTEEEYKKQMKEILNMSDEELEVSVDNIIKEYNKRLSEKTQLKSIKEFKMDI